MYIFYKKFTAQRIEKPDGLPNRGIQFYLAIVQVQKLVSPSYSKTTSLFKIAKQYRGRFVIIDFLLNDSVLTIANIYAPNKDDPHFFENFRDHLLDFQDQEIVLGGDFNLVLDPTKDKKG